MKRTMRPVSVETTSGDEIEISQATYDINGEADPLIVLSPDQGELLAQWIVEGVQEIRGSDASEGGPSSTSGQIRVRHMDREGNEDSGPLEVYQNKSGMIVLAIEPEVMIEMSPAMAKRLREQLSSAIRGAMTELFKPDSEV